MTETVAPPATNTDPQKETGKKTSYTVLKKVPTTGVVWGEGADLDLKGTPFIFLYVDTVEATSSNAAVRALNAEGTFVAVPVRSFNPVTVKTETKTVLKLT